MRRVPSRSWAATLFLLAFVVAHPAAAEPVAAAIGELLAAEQPGMRDVRTPPDLRSLRTFYSARDNRPAWTGTPQAEALAASLIAALRSAPEQGLSLRRYNLVGIEGRRRQGGARAVAEADLLLTDAFLRHARDLRPDQRLIDGLEPAPFDAIALLRHQLAGEAISFADLPPATAEYQRLRDGLRRYRELAAHGGWPTVPTGPSVKPGMSDERVIALRRRLAATGEATEADVSSPVLDDDLVAALKGFQRHHGLAEDGILGRGTVAALNVPVQRRIEQIEFNLERLRWLPRHMESTRLVVNAAAAQLVVYDEGEPAITMPVIVGDRDHATPVFRSEVASLVLNPPWRVPRSIAVKEILPKLRKDPAYLVANNISVLPAGPAPEDAAEGAGAPLTVTDWSAYGPNRFPFQLRQEPGPNNALGLIKFNVAGSRDIYLHDTPSRNLFDKSVRTLSHGCIRLSRPRDLALHLLKPRGVDEAKLDEILAAGRTKTISLGRKIPLYVLYFTAWVDPEGALQFRDDAYGRDRRLDDRLSDPFS